MKKIPIKIIFLLSLAILSVFSAVAFLYSGNSFAATSPDAIAVRIIPNPNHYSPIRWYSSQNFSGSPQSITVDGYDAVRDGRTVYVNVANVVDTNNDGVNDKLYTNIYLISYSQSAENVTLDIFGQILQHWKFNANIRATGNCSQTVDRVCLNTSECATGEHCNSVKAKIIRDTRRLADLADLSLKISSYKSANGYYPKISSGSYLANKTISTWPSWQGTLASALGTKLPVDPINKLGSCADNFDQTTCWDENNKTFGGTIDSSVSPAVVGLPSGSSVYTYSVNANGSGYSLTLSTESGSIGSNGSFTYDENQSSSGSNGGTTGNFGGETENKSSEFTGSNFPEGSSGNAYSGYIEGKNLDGNPITWSVSKIRFNSNGIDIYWQGEGTAESFLKNTCLWDAPSILALTKVSTQREIGAHKMGKSGTYTFTVVLDDKKNKSNSKVSKDFEFKVKNDPPLIRVTVPSTEAVIGKTLDYVPVKAKDPNENYPLAFMFYSSDPGAPALTCSTETVSEEYKYQCHVKVASLVAKTQEYAYKIKAIDYYGVDSDLVEFKVTITNNAPSISTESFPDAIACQSYNRQVSASDTDGHTIGKYLSSGQPDGLIMNESGLLNGIPKAPGDYTIDISAHDNYYDYTVSPYYASTNKALALKVKDEVFNLSINVPNSTIYLTPSGVPISSLYHSQLKYEAQADVNTQNSVTYELQGQPVWISINQTTGYIQGTPTTAGTSNFTVTAKNACGSVASANLTVTVNNNEWCGDAVTNGSEGCDNSLSAQACTSMFATGLPSYCTGIEISGTRTCKSDCTAWNACEVGSPEMVGNSSTACAATSPQMNDYACCELTSCGRDGCNCCGRSYGALTPSGYDLLNTLDPCGGSTTSCKISRSSSNPRNWIITTEHTTANYKCWK